MCVCMCVFNKLIPLRLKERGAHNCTELQIGSNGGSTEAVTDPGGVSAAGLVEKRGGVFWMRPSHPTSDPPGPPPPPTHTSSNSVGHIFCKSNSLFKPLKIDHNMEAHLALRGGAGLWVTNSCGLGIKSFILPSRHLTIGAHEALTTE